MKNKYKVEFIETTKYVIDVLAENETEAHELAVPFLDKVMANGTYHYYESRETEIELDTVYDVTNTDDPFDPINLTQKN